MHEHCRVCAEVRRREHACQPPPSRLGGDLGQQLPEQVDELLLCAGDLVAPVPAA
jgi:hypothetical protein